MKLEEITMQRLYSFFSLPILALISIGCAPKVVAQPSEVKALENPTPTALSEPSATAEVPTAEVLPHDSPASCPITQPPEAAFVPPSPYPAAPPERYVNEFWYGSPELWTMLGTEGTWYALPQDKNGYSQKVFWWSKDFAVSENPYPAFTVILEQLDVKSAPLVAAEKATNASADFGTAMLTGVEIPALGCWKITGKYADAELSFVVWVAP
jgi:hypothetical protein